MLTTSSSGGKLIMADSLLVCAVVSDLVASCRMSATFYVWDRG